MSLRAPARRWAIRASTAAASAVVLTAGLQFSAGALAATSSVTSASAKAAGHPARISAKLSERMFSSADPYAPAHHHKYRHGAVPTISRLAKMRAWALAHPGVNPALNSSALSYGGGVDGIGVTTGPEKVYLVFYGSQWGTQSTNAQGNITLSGDPSGVAPYLQSLFKGLGTGNELWSGVMTQYCQGVSAGTQTCPAGNTQHVGYPTGGALAGVWVDESAASPSAASGHQLGVVAVAAASHFGNTTAALNRNAQYDIISPHGTNPDNYKTGGFCAWHDYNGDTTLSGGAVSSSVGDVSFTNMPYAVDVGASCGVNFINSGSAGTLDGMSIVNGHEYAETITDQNPAGGWTNPSSGEENGDLCAWSQGPGAPAADLSLTTGTFAMQSTWGNDGAGGGDCEFSHAIVGNGGGGNTVTVTSPGNQTGTVGTAVSLQVSASDSASGQTLTFSGDRPARRAVHQLRWPDHRHANHSRDQFGHGDRHRHHRRTRIDHVQLDDQHQRWRWLHQLPAAGQPGLRDRRSRTMGINRRCHQPQRCRRDLAQRHLVRVARRLRHDAHRHAVAICDDPGRLHGLDVQLLAAHRHRRDDHHDAVRQADHHRQRHHAGDLLQPQRRERLHAAHVLAVRLRRHHGDHQVQRHRRQLAADLIRG